MLHSCSPRGGRFPRGRKRVPAWNLRKLADRASLNSNIYPVDKWLSRFKGCTWEAEWENLWLARSWKAWFGIKLNLNGLLWGLKGCSKNITLTQTFDPVEGISPKLLWIAKQLSDSFFHYKTELRFVLPWVYLLIVLLDVWAPPSSILLIQLSLLAYAGWLN